MPNPYNQLGKAMVARLIKGRLGTKIYLVTLGGFDTHAEQKNTHLGLLQKVSNAIRSTFLDLQSTGDADRVMMMTFSEFGRTVSENRNDDKAGTDHGTLAPIMLFGGGVNGQKFYGTPMDLSEGKVDHLGLVDFDTQDGAIDFRAVYDRVLRDWLCAGAQTSDDVLNYKVADNSNVEKYNESGAECSGTGTNCNDPLGGMILGGCNATVSQSAITDPNAAQVIFGYNFNSATSIDFKYATKFPANIKLTILDDNSAISIPVKAFHETGSYTHTFNPTAAPTDVTDTDTTITSLSPGKYLCRLEAGGRIIERTLVIH